MKSICFISNRYPNALTPTRQVFVQKLVWALADLGVKCTVISPIPVNQYFPDYRSLPLRTSEKSPGGAEIELHFPRYISLGQKKLLGFTFAHMTTKLFTSSVLKVFETLDVKPEAVYGHFFAPAGIAAARIGKMFDIPSFAAYGESTPWSILNYGKQKTREELASLAGVVSVSSANMEVLRDLDILNMEKIQVFPNGFQEDVFFPRDKTKSREKFNFANDAFIVSYVGQFSERKGVLRLAAAVDNLEDVYVAFAGKGPLVPSNENCIHKGTVPPEDIPAFLSASDIFVLPTLNEGCSNAIVEAMACGLPIVSSDLPFNSDLLDSTNAILVDPNNIKEIREAVIKLKGDTSLIRSKQEATLKRIKTLTLHGRALRIKNWMEEKIKEFNLVSI